MKDESTREQIVKAADKLFYQRGYSHTSFSDIADDVKISRGNFYYHFKTKDDILEAVIQARMSNLQTQLAKWEAEGETPVERICTFARMLIANQARIMRSGCPIGTLWAEMVKLDHTSQGQVSAMFMQFRSWLGRQFTLLGRASAADELAMHLLSRTQGVAMLANAFADEAFIRREVQNMCEWVESLVEPES